MGIKSRLDLIDRLGDFEKKAEYDQWRAHMDAGRRIMAALRVEFPTAPMKRTLSPDGKSYRLHAAEPGSPDFLTDLEAFADRIDAGTMTDADHEIMARLPDDDFGAKGITKLEYFAALAKISKMF